MKAIKILWINFLYPLLAVIGIYTILGWYWNTYVFGIQRNDSYANLVVIENGIDTTHVFKMIPPGKLKFEFKHNEPYYQITIDEYEGHPFFEWYKVTKASANIFLTEFAESNSIKPLKETIFKGGIITINTNASE